MDYILSHYINPHLFWLRSVHPTSTKGSNFEGQFDEYYKLNAESEVHVAHLEERVAYFDRRGSKWYRAVVDYIYDGTQNNQKSYILWLTDYGYPVHAEIWTIRKLEERFSKHAPIYDIIKCGVYGVVPCKTRYDFTNELLYEEMVNVWDEEAVEGIHKIMEEAIGIRFKEKSKSDNDHLFGKIIVTTNTGDQLDLKRSIVRSPYGTEYDRSVDFVSTVKKCKVTVMQRFQNNQSQNMFAPEKPIQIISKSIRHTKEGPSKSREKSVETHHRHDARHLALQTKEKKKKSLPKPTVETRKVKKDLTQYMPPKTSGHIKEDSSHKSKDITSNSETQFKMNKLDVASPKIAKKEKDEYDLTKSALPTPSITQSPTQCDQKSKQISEHVAKFFEHYKKPTTKAKKPDKSTEEIQFYPSCYDQVIGQIQRGGHMKKNSVIKHDTPKNVVEPSVEQPQLIDFKKDNVLNPFISVIDRITKENAQDVTSDDGSVARSNYSNLRPTLDIFTKTCEKNDKIPKSFLDCNTVLTHGRRIAHPIKSYTDANFHADIIKSMTTSRTETRRIQLSGWPHILQEKSAILIGGPGSGKTYTLIPAICSLVIRLITDEQVPVTTGPVAIIVSPFADEVSNLYRGFTYFLRHWNGNVNKEQKETNRIIVTESYGRAKEDEIKNALLVGNGIFVVTPPALARWINAWKGDGMPLFKLNRIKIFAVDDFDIIYKRYGVTICEQIETFCSNKLNNPTQLIITSTIWYPQLQKYSQYGKSPALFIANYIEASVYGKTQFLSTFVRSSTKLQTVDKFLDSYKTKRSLIICTNDDEVLAICEHLEKSNIKFIPFVQNSTELDRNSALTWHETPMTDEFSVLVCSDAVLGDLGAMQNVQKLLNFSLPESWSALSLRFAVFFGTYHDYFQNPKPPKMYEPPFAQILIDEKDHRTLPRLVDLLERIGAKIPTEVGTLARQMLIIREGSQASYSLCPYFLAFGIKLEECPRNKCKGRHALSNQDAPTKRMPALKTILKLKITEVHNPIHFSAQILGYRHLTERKFHDWQNVKQTVADDVLKFQLQQYYADDDNIVYHDSVNKGDLCALNDCDDYYRVQVLQISGKSGIDEKLLLTVRLIDNGKIREQKRINEMLVLPEKFKGIPPRAIDIYHIGVVPYDSDLNWNNRETSIIKKKIMDSGEEYFVKANVVFRLENNIWSDKITLCHKLHETFLLQDLLKNKLAEKTTETPQIDILKQMADDLGFNQEQEIKEEILVQQSPIEQIPVESTQNDSFSLPRGTWDYLNSDVLTEIEISNCDNPAEFNFVKIDRETKLDALLDLIDQFQNSDECCIMKDPQPNTNCLIPLQDGLVRGRIIERGRDEEGDYCRIFKCDYGRAELFALEEVFETSKDIIKFLPYIAMEGGIAGITPIEGEIFSKSVLSEIWTILRNAQDFGKLYAKVVGYKGNHDWLPGIYRYDLLLIIKSNDGEIKLVNHEIVNKKLAKWDSNVGLVLQKLSAKDIEKEFERDSDEEVEEMQEWEQAIGTYEHQKESPNDVDSDTINDFRNMLELQSDISDDEMTLLCNAFNLPHEMIHQFLQLRKIKVESNQSPLKAIEPKPKETIQQRHVTKTCPEVIDLKADRLIYTTRQSKILWQQNHSLIILSIPVGDTPDYHLEVHSSYMIFVHFISPDEEPRVTVINFFGTVKTEQVSHQIRGLNLRIRLPKVSYFNRWPRLTHEKENFSHIKCNLDTLKPLDEDFLPVAWKKKNYNNSENSDNESLGGFDSNDGLDEFSDDNNFDD